MGTMAFNAFSAISRLTDWWHRKGDHQTRIWRQRAGRYEEQFYIKICEQNGCNRPPLGIFGKKWIDLSSWLCQENEGCTAFLSASRHSRSRCRSRSCWLARARVSATGSSESVGCL